MKMKHINNIEKTNGKINFIKDLSLFEYAIGTTLVFVFALVLMLML